MPFFSLSAVFIDTHSHKKFAALSKPKPKNMNRLFGKLINMKTVSHALANFMAALIFVYNNDDIAIEQLK